MARTATPLLRPDPCPATLDRQHHRARPGAAALLALALLLATSPVALLGAGAARGERHRGGTGAKALVETAACPSGPGVEDSGTDDGFAAMAQTYAAKSTGRLVGANLIAEGSGTYDVEVRRLEAGKPTGVAIAQAAVAKPVAAKGRLVARFSNQPRLNKGVGSALVVTLPPVSGKWLYERKGNWCPGFEWIRSSASPSEPFENDRNYDLIFAVVVKPTA